MAHMKFADVKAAGIATAANVAITAMFGLTCFSLYEDRTATASVSAALTLAFVLFRQLPILESFEVLSLKAKFAARIGEAEKLLAHIRRNVAVSSKLSYVQLAFMNRMGDIGWSRKRALLEEIDGLLRQVEVPQGDITAMKAPFLNLVSLDLSRVYEHTISELLRASREKLDGEIGAYRAKPIPAGDPHWASMVEQRRALDVSTIDWGDSLGNPALANLRRGLTAWTAKIPLPAKEAQFAGLVLGEVAHLSEQCWAAGTVTLETEEYLNLYGSRTRSRIDDSERGFHDAP